MIEPADVARRLDIVRNRIADAGGDDAVTIVAVTKGFGPDAVVAAHAVGLNEVGENYAQEMVEKRSAVGDAVRDALTWHFIGQLQSNKVRLLAGHVDLWQTIDRVKLGSAIVRRTHEATVDAGEGRRRPSTLVQVNPGAGDHKGGCALDKVPALVAVLRDAGVDVVGLMSVGIAGDDGATRRAFDDVIAMADRLELSIRSMGMSADLELAVAAGTTMVRIGSDLFGPRPQRQK